MAEIVTEHPRPSYRLAQFSDLHLTGDGTLLYGAADADGHLAELLDALEASGLRPDALVFSGDLADHGERSAYRRLTEIVEPVAARMGAAVVWATGNHDDRAVLRPALLGGPATQDPIDYVAWVGGLRIVVLDTSVPGQHHGTVEPEQRAWLAEQLATAAPDGTILVMHHPPLPAVLDLAVTVELRGQRDLAPVLRGTDVRAILAGHVHYSTFGTFAGVPVSVASSTAYSQDLTVEVGGTRGRDGAQAFTLVDVYSETVVHSVVPIGHHPTVGQFVGAAETRRRLAAGGFTVPTATAAR